MVEFWGQRREGEPVPWPGARNCSLAVAFCTGRLESQPPSGLETTSIPGLLLQTLLRPQCP